MGGRKLLFILLLHGFGWSLGDDIATNPIILQVLFEEEIKIAVKLWKIKSILGDERSPDDLIW